MPHALQVADVLLQSAVHQLAVAGERDVGHPRFHAVEDVRGVHHRGTALLALLLQEVEQVQAAEDVEVDGDLVAEENLERLEETHADLHPSSLAVADPHHVPVDVDVEDVDEVSPAVLVDALDAEDHLARADVARQRHGTGAAHVATPLRAEVPEVAGAREVGVVERGTADDADVLDGDHGLAREHLEQRGLARAVRAREQASRAGREGEGEVLDDLFAHGVRVAEVVDDEAGRRVGARGSHSLDTHRCVHLNVHYGGGNHRR